MRSSQYLAAIAALLTSASAQTFTLCNPLEKTCAPDPALGRSVAYDFTKGAPSDFVAAAGKAPVFGSSGATFGIDKAGEAPTLSSKWFIMFGNCKVVMKAAPGQGIVSSVVLQSNDLDEIDWEWVGSEGGKVQTNYFGKGNTTTYDRGITVPDGTSSDGFNTYEIDWTAEKTRWIINGRVVRTLTPATASYNQYPQSPMQFKLGNWAAGESELEGTREWAGGRVDFSKAPFNMIVKSVQISDYSTGKSYSYGDKSGSWQSIKSDGGEISGSGSVPSEVSTVTGSGTKITASATASALSNQQPVVATTTNSAQLGSGTVSFFHNSTTMGVWNTTYTSQGAATTSAAGTGAGNGTGAGAGTGTGNGGNRPTTTTTAAVAGSSIGAGAILQPVAGLAAAGLFAVLAL